MGGSLAAAVFVAGAVAGAFLSARWIGVRTLAAEMANFTGTECSRDQGREILLVGVLVTGVPQAFVVSCCWRTSIL